jgi:hypothetical protein
VRKRACSCSPIDGSPGGTSESSSFASILVLLSTRDIISLLRPIHVYSRGWARKSEMGHGWNRFAGVAGYSSSSVTQLVADQQDSSLLSSLATRQEAKGMVEVLLQTS